LIQATEGKLSAEKKLLDERKAHEKLEKLTRALQEERIGLLKQLKELKGQQQSPETISSPVENAVVEAKQDCANGNVLPSVSASA